MLFWTRTRVHWFIFQNAFIVTYLNYFNLFWGSSAMVNYVPFNLMIYWTRPYSIAITIKCLVLKKSIKYQFEQIFIPFWLVIAFLRSEPLTFKCEWFNQNVTLVVTLNCIKDSDIWPPFLCLAFVANKNKYHAYGVLLQLGIVLIIYNSYELLISQCHVIWFAIIDKCVPLIIMIEIKSWLLAYCFVAFVHFPLKILLNISNLLWF